MDCGIATTAFAAQLLVSVLYPVAVLVEAVAGRYCLNDRSLIAYTLAPLHTTICLLAVHIAGMAFAHVRAGVSTGSAAGYCNVFVCLPVAIVVQAIASLS